MKGKSRKIIRYENIVIPIDIFKEMRMDVRVALVKDKAIVRVPLFYSKKQLDKTLDWAKNWIFEHMRQNPTTKERFVIKKYSSGDILSINNHTFTLQLNVSDNKNYTAVLNDNIISITIPRAAISDDLANQKALKTLQSRIVGQYFQKEISARIRDLNDKYFGFEINKIRLKYNKSNWGSRSDKSNINISTRLLFAPRDVQDYVFVHELAHFVEMNHSAKFWKIVRDIIPDYKEKEKWLRANGNSCDF